MNNRLTICYIVRPPFMYNETLINGDKVGFDIEVMETFCKVQNYSCSYLLHPSNMYAYYKNGTWHGMIKYIQDKVCDMSTMSAALTEERFRLVDFTLPIDSLPFLLVTRNTESSQQISVVSSLVFSWTVWLVLILLAALIGLAMAFNQNTRSLLNCISYCTDVFSIVTAQTNLQYPNRRSIRVLLTFWSFAMLILCEAYSGQLVSSMVRNKSKIPFNNFESFVDCVENNECRLIVNELITTSPIIHDILYSNITIYKRLRDKFITNPLLVGDSTKQILDKISLEKDIYLTSILLSETYLRETEMNKNCMYKSFTLRNERMGALITKHNRFLEEILNRFIAKFAKSAYSDKLSNKYFGKESVCERSQLLRETRPITVASFFGCIFILMVGTSVASGTFVMELLKVYYGKYKKSSTKYKV